MEKDIIIPKKSKFGEPCSGCGTCCAAEICGIGKEAFPGVEDICPGLIYLDNRLWCKLILIEALVGLTDIAEALGAGKGCCADDSLN